ncbi:hypothetical protein DJ72_11260, partial [Halorubrum distributum]
SDTASAGVSLADLPAIIPDADLVVTATGSPDLVVHPSYVDGAGRVVCIDIAQPRDVDPAAAGVEDVELHGEDQDEHDPEPEVRRGDAAERQQRRAVVDRLVAPGRADHAQRNREDDGDDAGGDGQFDRRGEAAEHERHDVLPLDVREPHIAAQQVEDVLEVLDVQRLVEPQLGGDRLSGLLRGVERRDRVDRATGRDEPEREHDRDDAPDDADPLEASFDCESSE